MSGQFELMPFAIAFSSIVLPAFGGETIKPRCPRPIGATRLRSRVERMFGAVSRLISSSGKMGVSESNDGRRRAVSASMPLTASTRSRLKNFSLSFGGRT
jgi:hypothetical protein